MIRTDAHYIGRPVRSLQTMLRALSYVYPFLPRVTPDGVFGEATLEAVMLLQREFFPPVTGRVDLATWDGIAALYRQAEGRPGAESAHLGGVQSAFRGLAEVLDGVEPGEITGRRDGPTQRNLQWLQRAAARPETGEADPESRDALDRLHRLFVIRAPAERPG